MNTRRIDIAAPSGSELSVLFRVNPRAKRLILRVDPKTQSPVVTAPSPRHYKAAEKFVQSKAGWIENQICRQPDVITLEPGIEIPVSGEMHLLTQSGARGRTRQIEGTPPQLDSPGADITYSDRVLRYLKMKAREALNERVDVHAERLAVDPVKITIRDTRSRWGSCSSKGHLNFSWRLILAPPQILDYVAAHEVAHLIEMNHSADFWALVEKSYGPHKNARNWLKQNGRVLHAYGSSGSAGG